jgi:hypothetical protein
MMDSQLFIDPWSQIKTILDNNTYITMLSCALKVLDRLLGILLVYLNRHGYFELYHILYRT